MSWYVDGAGVGRAVPHAIPGLCGKGNPVTNGVHLSKVRSSSSGVVASAEEIPPRNTSDVADEVRISYSVKAVGSEAGARAQAEAAARAIANAVTAHDRWPMTVTTQGGDVVRVLWAHTPEGPTFSGDVGGEVTYRFDVTYRCQGA